MRVQGWWPFTLLGVLGDPSVLCRFFRVAPGKWDAAANFRFAPAGDTEGYAARDHTAMPLVGDSVGYDRADACGGRGASCRWGRCLPLPPASLVAAQWRHTPVVGR